MRYLVDTNVLLRWCHADSPDHALCTGALDTLLKNGHELCVCAQILIEFWCVATRPINLNGLGLTAEAARDYLNDLRAMFTCLPEPPDIAERWQEVAEKRAVQGRQAHDARIAAFM